MARILLLDDEQPLLQSLSVALGRSGHECLQAGTGRDALEWIESQAIDLAILDVQLPDMSGLDVLRRLRAELPEAPVLVVTAYASVDTAVEAMKEGAIDYLEKPLDLEELSLVVERELANAQIRSDVEAYRRSEAQLPEILGASEAMDHVRTLVRQVAEIPMPNAGDLPSVLIEGETGSGKGLVARAIHDAGPLADRPFVHVNCASLPRDLVESELFGHEKGAFTGAERRKQGLFEVAKGGSIFLDEIGPMPLELQAKLLTAIESKRFRRIGGTREHRIEARILAATNRDLEHAIEEGSFRSDLYYRLRVVHIDVPPLRERRGDVRLLAEHFLAKHRLRYGRPEVSFQPDEMNTLERWNWPGNVRELDHTVERMVITSQGQDLGPAGLHAVSKGREVPFDFEAGDCTLESVERRLVEDALRHTGMNVSEAARLLGLTRGGLRHKMTKWGIDVE